MNQERHANRCDPGCHVRVVFDARAWPIDCGWHFIDAHPRVEVALPRDVTVSVDWIFQWRESVRDGVYSVPGFLIIPAGKSDPRFVGHRPRERVG
jgi:hypothetical protein